MSDEKDEKIEVHAVYRKDGSLFICDQHGRDFAGRPSGSARMSDNMDAIVLVDVTMNAPEYPGMKPRVEVRLSVPLDVEERMPDWMQEYLAGRG